MVPRKFLTVVFLSMAMGAWLAHAARAEDSIWSGLVLATNEEQPKAAAPELEKYYAKLKNIFGYNQYELLGQHLESMDSPDGHWLIPRKDFFLRVESKKAEKPGFYRLKMDLYEQDSDESGQGAEKGKLLAEMEARISGQNTFFIRGPYYGKGQIIIILMMK